jgi:hypothetical protein
MRTRAVQDGKRGSTEMDEVDDMNRMAGVVDFKAASWPPQSKTQAPNAEQNILSVMRAV